MFMYTNQVFEINLKSLDDVIPIWFFGDVHRDCTTCDTERWGEFLLESSKDKDAYFIGMGDYHDFASTREKRALVNAGLHETTLEMFDQIAQSTTRKFAEEIKHMRGRTICLIEGNHHWKYANGKTSTDDLAERLQTVNAGWLTHINLAVTFDKRPKNCLRIRLVLCHGKAGGKTAGATINQVDDLRRVFPAADIYAMGHDHQRGVWPSNVLIPNRYDKVRQKKQYLCRTGSFKHAYTPGKESYEVSRLVKPADLGPLKLTINFRRKHTKDDGDQMIHIIKAYI